MNNYQIRLWAGSKTTTKSGFRDYLIEQSSNIATAMDRAKAKVEKEFGAAEVEIIYIKKVN